MKIYKKNIDDAKTSKEEALALKQEYEAKILEAKKESQEIIEQGRKRGEEVRESIIIEAKEEANNIIEKAKKGNTSRKRKSYFGCTDEGRRYGSFNCIKSNRREYRYGKTTGFNKQICR